MTDYVLQLSRVTLYHCCRVSYVKVGMNATIVYYLNHIFEVVDLIRRGPRKQPSPLAEETKAQGIRSTPTVPGSLKV